MKSLQKCRLFNDIFDGCWCKIRWPITATKTAKRNTVNKGNLSNKKALLTFKKGLLSYKEDLLTYTKKEFTYKFKKTRGKFLRQSLTVNSYGKFSRQILEYVMQKMV